MNNPFDNVPSTADIPESVDKRVITTLTALTERFEGALTREEAVAKNQEELAGVMFETFLDDDGSIKDIAHSAEIISALRQTISSMDKSCERIEAAQREMPTSIKAHLCEDDRNLLDSNFIRLKNLIKLNLPIVIGIGALVGICLMGSVMVSKSATDKRHEYEHRIKELDRWHQENADVISFGQFYRENYPKKYREWQIGRWQQDIAYRDSLIRAHSLDRLKRLNEDR
ncbi:hypothetical protein [uncultured Bacteroides sp.]|uniref:hypothetical protein n=1 Tax=uncultured Bacteroides sp. TaxID=162156 RepID=UPI00266FB9F5|nr:hypothetical protein [uncultured Bacteroides sp.]